MTFSMSVLYLSYYHAAQTEQTNLRGKDLLIIRAWYVTFPKMPSSLENRHVHSPQFFSDTWLMVTAFPL